MERKFHRTARKDSLPFVSADAAGGRCTAHDQLALSLPRDHQVQWISAETMSELQQLVTRRGNLDANCRPIFQMHEQIKQGTQTRVLPYRPARPSGVKASPILPDYTSYDNILPNPFSSVNRIQNPSVRSANGAFGTFTEQLPAKAQLTIFYGGRVNVYDEVSLDKAQAIMSLMENERSNNSSNSENLRKSSHLEDLKFKSTKVDHLLPHSIMAPPSPCFSVTGSAASNSPTPSMCGSNITDGIKSEQRTVTLHEPFETRAVPMSRKASIVRFLEKRKERMTNLNPYFLDYKISKEGIKVNTVGNFKKTIGSEMDLCRSTDKSCCLKNDPNNIHNAKFQV